MVRTTVFALATAIAAMLTIPAADAIARPMHGGFHAGGSFRGGPAFRSGVAFRSGPAFVRRGPVFVHRGPVFVRRHAFIRRAPIFIGAGIYANSCWRWVPTAFGLRRVWVCHRYWAGRPYWPYY